jgi:hypothetical protein
MQDANAPFNVDTEGRLPATTMAALLSAIALVERMDARAYDKTTLAPALGEECLRLLMLRAFVAERERRSGEGRDGSKALRDAFNV